jgi:hypothetical protein
VSATVLYGLIGLHVAAIAYYYFRKKQNLVKPMITGDQDISFEAQAADDSAKMRLLAAVIFALCAAGVYYVIKAQP